MRKKIPFVLSFYSPQKRYGDHLSKSEVDALVAPHPSSVEMVDSWLAHYGVTPGSRTSSGDWVTMTVTVEQAEKMLGAKYNVYKHTITSETIVRTMSYSLPRVIHEHVAVVAPATYFGTMKAMKATSFVQSTGDSSPLGDSAGGVDPSCSSKITPACLRELYNSASYVPSATDRNTLGIAGYLDQFANYDDLQVWLCLHPSAKLTHVFFQTFFKAYREDAVNATFQTVQVNGGRNDQTKPGLEANLDIQYTEGITYPTPNIYYR